MPVKLTRELLSTGLSGQDLARLCRQDTLVRIRHGAYDQAREGDVRRAHTQLIASTWPLLGPASTLSHSSAAALHGLPIWAEDLGRVTILRPMNSGHGVRRPYLHVRRSDLLPLEVTCIDGYRVTSLERTAVDAACLLAYDRAVAVLDAALRLGADARVLADTIAAARGRHGNRTVRSAATMADGRSESVGESVSRVRMAQAGLPMPVLQFDVHDDVGIWIARTDFAWIERGVLGEFDGRVKYLGDEQFVADTVMAEKRREQAIRDAGWWIVRWTWRDLDDVDAFRRRILRAFESAPRRA